MNTRTMNHERLARLLARETMERERRPVTAAPPEQQQGAFNQPLAYGCSRAYTPVEDEAA